MNTIFDRWLITHGMSIDECRNQLEKLGFRVPTFTVIQGHRNRHGSFGNLWLPISDP